MQITSTILYFIIFIFVIGPILYRLAIILYKYLLPEKQLSQIYGQGTWVIITGASRGQGRLLAHGFAKRGFNLVLIGSSRSNTVAQEITLKYPHIKVDVIIRDFSHSITDPQWWHDIDTLFNGSRDISILINNVGQRTASNPSHIQHDDNIRKSLITGTYPQIRLTNLALQYMTTQLTKIHINPPNPHKYAIIFNTAQCIHPTLAFASYISPSISVPYLSVYEATNAFGYFHANNIIDEYTHTRNNIHLLNITPGAVITENTPYLTDTFFSVTVNTFVDGIFRLMGGNWYGESCAYWGHELSSILICFAPWIKQYILQNVGNTIATNLNNN